MQPELFNAHHYSVTSLTRQVRELLETDKDLQNLWVEGEISNISRPASGHVYFSMKDASAQLRCVMWRQNATRMKFKPSDGQHVEAHGSIGVYEAGGQYQLYVDLLQPLGEGALFAEFLRLKEQLEAEGLFAQERKRALPLLPQRIGIVTSPSGAALQDILDTLGRRYRMAEVILAPTPVQGSEAPPEIVAAIRALNRDANPDVILLARGGGSMEDLWAFNDERVVRAVVCSEAPIITGVGHETDFTLVDFAADLRAPTPTAAAELATPITMEDLKQNVTQIKSAILESIQYSRQQKTDRIAWSAKRLQASAPLRRVMLESQRLDEASARLRSGTFHQVSLTTAQMEGVKNRLLALNPKAVLQRGYAIVRLKQTGNAVFSKNQVNSGDEVDILVRDGGFDARVTGVQE